MKTRKPDRTVPPRVNVLLYGAPKSGKTAGACSVKGGVLLINADLPNAAWYAHSLDEDGRISEADLTGRVLDTMEEVVTMIRQQVAPSAEPIYGTVVVDTVGELYRRLLDEMSDDALRKTLPQYGDTSTYIERFCRALCEAQSVNAVFVCHEAPVKNEATGAFETLPLTGTSNPALGQKLMGMVDVVGYCGVVEQEGGAREYQAQLVTDFGRRGGDRFDCLDEGTGYRTLNLAEWIDVIHAKVAPKKQEPAIPPAEVENVGPERASAPKAPPRSRSRAKKSTSTQRKAAA